MTFNIYRTYYPYATNGVIKYKDTYLCYCIEREWADNVKANSCIPEGEYEVIKRWSVKHKDHFEITGVPDRSLILFHVANYEQKELQGCIAPVTRLHPTTAGIGYESRKAFEKLKAFINSYLDRGEKVFVRITSKPEREWESVSAL